MERGTLIEMENELSKLKNLNERGGAHSAWVIAPIPGCQTSFTKSWLVLARSPPSSAKMAFPSMTDRFTIDVEESVQLAQGTYTLYHLSAARIPNPYEDIAALQGTPIPKLAAFKVEVPRCQTTDSGEQVELDIMAHLQAASGLDLSGVLLDESNLKHILIRWEVTSQTFEVELDALDYLVAPKRSQDRGPGHRARLAFAMLQNFQPDVVEMTNLHAHFAHLAQPHKAAHKVPPLLLKKLDQFNPDHMAAYEGLTHIKNGLFFVNGCPGAGKTEWNMVVSGLIQSH